VTLRSPRSRAGLALAAIVAGSSVLEFLLARRVGAPRIFGDEFIYAELARSLADTGAFGLRGVPGNDFGVLYPLLIAPAFLLDRLPDAYEVVKAINAIVMSLAAVPVYLLARRILGRGPSLLAAMLAVAVPSMLYTATVMTENLFYPLFCLFALALALLLERPSAGRQLAALGSAGLAFLCRPQAVALVAALLAGIVLSSLVEAHVERGSARARLAAFRLTWVVTVGLGVAALVVFAVSGRSPRDALGAYGVLAGGPDPVATVGWAIAHLAELDLYVAVLPFATLPLAFVAAFRGPGATARTRAFAVTLICTGVALLLVTAAFSATEYGLGRLHERNLFYVAPLVFVAFLLWLDSGVRPPARRVTLACVLWAVALVAAVPYGRAAGSASSDALAVVPWLELFDGSVSRAVAASLVACALAALLFALPRTFRALSLTAILVFLFVTTTFARDAGEGGAVALVGRGAGSDWIDRTVTHGAVTAVYVDAAGCLTGSQVYRSWQSHWQTAFFNRRVESVVAIGAPSPDGLPARVATIDDGVLVQHNRPVLARYLAVDAALPVRGRVLGRNDATRIQLVETAGSVRFNGVEDDAAAVQRLCAAG
jgi:hypothetical protein